MAYLQLIKPDLSDEKTDALARLLSDKIDNDRYPLSPRIQTLKAILAKIRPEPVRTPPPTDGADDGSISRRLIVFQRRVHPPHGALKIEDAPVLGIAGISLVSRDRLQLLTRA